MRGASANCRTSRSSTFGIKKNEIKLEFSDKVVPRLSVQVPDSAPLAYRQLATKCMSRDLGDRPGIEEVVTSLEAQISELSAEVPNS